MSLDILIVGGGSIGERHLRSFQQIGRDVALCETNAQRRLQIAERYLVQHCFESLEVATRQSWAGIVICTPAHLHAEHVEINTKRQTPACRDASMSRNVPTTLR